MAILNHHTTITPTTMKTAARTNEAPPATAPDPGLSLKACNPATGNATRTASSEIQKMYLKNHNSLNLTSTTTSATQISRAIKPITESYLRSRFIQLTVAHQWRGARDARNLTQL